MFQQGAYDVLEFSPPMQGMNQNFSPDVLPLDFSYVLENYIPRPGELVARFGTSEEIALNNPESNIIRQFPFITTNGKEQIILYVQEYTQDSTATAFNLIVNDSRSFSFTSPNNSAKYVKDTPIKVQYTFNGIQTIYDTIKAVNIQGTTVTITLTHNSFPPINQNPILNIVSYSTGTLYKYEVSTGIIGNALKTNLSVGCVPRSVTFLNTLVICNGVNRLLAWDGTTLREIYDLVKEQTVGLTRINNTQLSFTIPKLFNINDYAVGKLLQITVSGVATQTTITASSVAGQLVTITVQNNLPAFANGQTNVFYQAYPPPFNFLFVSYNRLWALGPGAVGLDYRAPNEAMKVYSAYRNGSLTDLFDENTKAVPSVDISDFQGGVDNLEAIAFVNGNMIFVGREKTQVWAGTYLAGTISIANSPPLTYQSTISTGIINGDLIIELPNDIYFITKTGLQSVSSLNIARQFAATSLNAVDPLIKEYITSLSSSNINYRACSSFKYNGGSLAAFKIGNNKILCSLFSTNLYAWSLFSGDFLKARSFLAIGNSLYLSIKNKLYKYADGNDGSLPVYGDQNGTGIIFLGWSLPWIHLKGSGFACKRYEIQLDCPSSFTIDRSNQMTIEITGDLPKSYEMNSPCRFDLRGDAFGTIPFTTDNPATEDSLGFRFAQPYSVYKDRLKFLASRFWLSLKGYTKYGPLTIRKIKLYGIIERK